MVYLSRLCEIFSRCAVEQNLFDQGRVDRFFSSSARISLDLSVTCNEPKCRVKPCLRCLAKMSGNTP